MTDKPPASNRIKLGLFIPWDEDGRLFNEEKFMPPLPEPTAKAGKIIQMPPRADKPKDSTDA